MLLLLRLPVQPAAAVDSKGVLSLKDSWREALAAIGQPGFIDSLLRLDRDRVSDEDVELLYPYLVAEDFTHEAAKKASGAVGGLCTWVRAMVTYQQVSKEVKPKIAQHKLAEGQLRAAMSKLEAAQAELDECQAAYSPLLPLIRSNSAEEM